MARERGVPEAVMALVAVIEAIHHAEHLGAFVENLHRQMYRDDADNPEDIAGRDASLHWIDVLNDTLHWLVSTADFWFEEFFADEGIGDGARAEARAWARTVVQDDTAPPIDRVVAQRLLHLPPGGKE